MRPALVPRTQDADRSRADVPSEGPHSGNLRLLKVGCCTACLCSDGMPAEHLRCC